MGKVWSGVKKKKEPGTSWKVHRIRIKKRKKEIHEIHVNSKNVNNQTRTINRSTIK